MISTKKIFSSRTSALVLWAAFGVSALVGGISYAQEGPTLKIPSDIANAVIAIQKIYFSDDGTKWANLAPIQIDGTAGTIKLGKMSINSMPAKLEDMITLRASDGSIEAIGDIAAMGNINAKGDMTVGNELLAAWTVKLPWYACATLPTGVGQGGWQGTPVNIDPCILGVDGDWEVFTDGFLNTVLNYSGDINEILWGLWDLSSTSNDNDIYFADPSGGVSANDVLVRIGIKKDSGKWSDTDAQLVARGEIQSREGLTILSSTNSANNDNILKDAQVGNGQIAKSSIRQSSDGNTMYIQHETPNNMHGGNIVLKWRDNTDAPTKVGINKDVPTEALDVVGNAKISKNLNVGQQVKASTYLYNSDVRYKPAIVPLDNALDKILALNGYSYFNKLSGRNDIGIIAQEVEKIFPELVHTNETGYKSVEYANLVAPLIEAVKELNSKLDVQTTQINNLEARLQALEAK